MGGKFGFSFSWRRALGISAFKSRLSKQIGMPLTQAGRERKVGRMVMSSGLGWLGLGLGLMAAANRIASNLGILLGLWSLLAIFFSWKIDVFFWAGIGVCCAVVGLVLSLIKGAGLRHSMFALAICGLACAIKALAAVF